jgi:hypothetical protein
MAKKIDEQAVASVLQTISLLLSPASKSVGPQLWQGGSAGRFAGTLSGHNKSLASMMDEVWKVEKAANNDTPPAPPAMPQVQPPPSSNIALLNPDLADKMAGSLDSVANQLPGLGKKLAGLLATASPPLDTGVCTSVAHWCGEQARTMRNRAQYARASDKVGFHFAASNSPNKGMASIPNADTWGSQEMGALGRLQAKLFDKSIDSSGAQARSDIAALGSDFHQNSADPSYAAYLAGFLGNIKPGSIGKLPYWLHRQQANSEQPLGSSDKKIIGDYGDAVAAMSRFEGRAHPGSDERPITERVLGRYGLDMPGQGLLVKLSLGKWDSHVLAQLGVAALRWRVQYHNYQLKTKSRMLGANGVGDPLHPNWWFQDWNLSPGNGQINQYDPALNILGKIRADRDARAARELATTHLPPNLHFTGPLGLAGSPASGDGKELATYVRLLVASDWGDGGAFAGDVAKLATHQDGSMSSRTKAQAAQAAAQIMKATADWNNFYRHGFRGLGPMGGTMSDPSVMPKDWSTYDLGPGLRKDLGLLANEYVPSLAVARQGSSGRQATDPVTGQSYAHINDQDAQGFLRTMVGDKKLRMNLLAASEIYNRALIKYSITHDSPHTWPGPGAAANSVGLLFRNINQAYETEQVEPAKEKDAARAELLKEIKAARDVAAGVVDLATEEIPGAPIAVELATIGTDSAIDSMEGKALQEAQKELKVSSFSSQQMINEGIIMAVHDIGRYSNDKIRVEGEEDASLGKFFNKDGTLNMSWIGSRNGARYQALGDWAARTELPRTDESLRRIGDLMDKAQGGYKGEEP